MVSNNRTVLVVQKYFLKSLYERVVCMDQIGHKISGFHVKGELLRSTKNTSVDCTKGSTVVLSCCLFAPDFMCSSNLARYIVIIGTV